MVFSTSQNASTSFVWDLDFPLRTVGRYGLTGLLWLSLQGAFAQTDREWEITRFNRQEAIRNKLADSLKNRLECNALIGISYGNYVLPGYEGVSESNTYVNMRQSHRVVNLSYDKFLTQRISLGVELGFHFLNQTVDITGSRVKGGGGLVNTALIQIKYFFPPSPTVPNRRLYVLAGSGFTQTVVASISASTSSGNMPTPDIFTQAGNTINLGGGIYQRLGKYTMGDVSLRYMYSHSYDPYIGSVRSFSPFQLDLKLGGVLYSGFRRMEKQLAR